MIQDEETATIASLSSASTLTVSPLQHSRPVAAALVHAKTRSSIVQQLLRQQQQQMAHDAASRRRGHLPFNVMPSIVLPADCHDPEEDCHLQQQEQEQNHRTDADDTCTCKTTAAGAATEQSHATETITTIGTSASPRTNRKLAAATRTDVTILEQQQERLPKIHFEQQQPGRQRRKTDYMTGEQNEKICSTLTASRASPETFNEDQGLAGNASATLHTIGHHIGDIHSTSIILEEDDSLEEGMPPTAATANDVVSPTTRRNSGTLRRRQEKDEDRHHQRHRRFAIMMILLALALLLVLIIGLITVPIPEIVFAEDADDGKSMDKENSTKTLLPSSSTSSWIPAQSPISNHAIESTYNEEDDPNSR